MNKVIKKKNFGPCVVCGGNQNPSIQYRKITAQSILKINKSPNIENLNIELKVDDQLCKKHYNELIVYERGKVKMGQKQKNHKDKSYYPTGEHPKRICLTQEKYENLIETSEKVDKLQECINKLETKLEQALSNIIINYCIIIILQLLIFFSV